MKNEIKKSFGKRLGVLLVFVLVYLTFSVTALANSSKHVMAVNGRNVGKNYFDELTSIIQTSNLPKYKNNNKLYKYSYNTDAGLWNKKKKKEVIKKIYSTMDSAFSKNSAGDLSFFYYSGHGEKPSEKNSSRGALPIGHFGMFISDNKNTMDRITFDDLVKKLATYKGKMVVIIDCCYSGCIVEAAKHCLSSKDLNRFMFVCAGSKGEEVQSGRFSKRVVDILKNTSECEKKDLNKDGYISGSELMKDMKVYGQGLTHPFVEYTDSQYKTFPIFSYKVTRNNLLLDKKSLSICVGETYQMKVIAGRKSGMRWSSSNKSIATVNSTGKITGKKAGTVKITAKVGGKTATCSVTVKKSGNQSSAKTNNKLSKKEQHKLYESTIKSYAKSMKNGAKKWNEDSGLKTYFAFVDIDKNGTDELIVRAVNSTMKQTTASTSGYGENTHIYTIKNNKVKKVLGNSTYAPTLGHVNYVRVYKNCKYNDRGFSHLPADYIFYKYSNGILASKPTYRFAVGGWGTNFWSINGKNVSKSYCMKQLNKVSGNREGYPMHKYSASTYKNYL